MSGLEILEARYGDASTDGNMVDVLDKITAKVWPDKSGISVQVSPSSIGVPDPAPSKTKTLIVRYMINGGGETSVQTPDSATLLVQVPGTTPKSGLGEAASVYGTLWTSVYGAGCVFVLVMTTAFAFQLGWNGYASWILLVIVALMLPYVGIIGIVLVVIIHTAINGEFVAFKPVSFASRAASFARQGLGAMANIGRRARVAMMNTPPK